MYVYKELMQVYSHYPCESSFSLDGRFPLKLLYLKTLRTKKNHI